IKHYKISISHLTKSSPPKLRSLYGKNGATTVHEIIPFSHYTLLALAIFYPGTSKHTDAVRLHAIGPRELEVRMNWRSHKQRRFAYEQRTKYLHLVEWYFLKQDMNMINL
ncbi:hypothetical protein ACJX0J_031268, partial [Zea mays]